MKKNSKRRQGVAPSSKFIGMMEPLEARQMLSATIDLRTTSGGKNVTVSSVGQVVNLDVWAVVTGTDSNSANDGFQWAHGSFLSSDVGGGAAGGTLSASVQSPFDATASSNGTQVDLDGDGDLDLLVTAIGGGTRLFLNDGRGRFTESTTNGVVRRFAGITIAMADIDGDGDLDL